MDSEAKNKIQGATPMATVQIASDLHRKMKIIALQNNERIMDTYDRVLRSVIFSSNNQPAA